jgi:hypothetical protein
MNVTIFEIKQNNNKKLNFFSDNQLYKLVFMVLI